MNRPSAVDTYLNFVLYATLGRLAEADTIMKRSGAQVRAVADFMRAAYPIEPRPIYRGLLLDPSEPYRVDEHYTFLSWSEDLDVARWFASPNTVISEPLMEAKPHLRGYVATLAEPTTRVLFHHRWHDVFGTPLEMLAWRHPHMGVTGGCQIKWSLATQREVITEPVEIDPKPIETPPNLAEINARLMPPWLVEVSRG